MLIDKLLTLSNQQAVTADAASTDHIDFLAANVGDGEELRLVGIVTTAFATLTSLTIKLQSDDNSSFSSPSDDYTSSAIAAASLTAGAKVLDVPLPRGLQRYVRGYYDVGGSDATAGKITLTIVKNSDNRKVYASGYSTGH